MSFCFHSYQGKAQNKSTCLTHGYPMISFCAVAPWIIGIIPICKGIGKLKTYSAFTAFFQMGTHFFPDITTSLPPKKFIVTPDLSQFTA